MSLLSFAKAVTQSSGTFSTAGPATINVSVVGHSHTLALKKALEQGHHQFIYPIRIINLRLVDGGSADVFIEGMETGECRLHPQLREQLLAECPDASPSLTVSLIGGNAHNVLGLLRHPQPFDFSLPGLPDLPFRHGCQVLPCDLVRDALKRLAQPGLSLLSACRAAVAGPMVHLESPPPIGDDDHVRRYLDPFFAERGHATDIAPRLLRYKLWRLHSEIVRRRCAEIGVAFVPVPAEVLDAEGFLRRQGYSRSATHGNGWYGAKVLAQVAALADAIVAGSGLPVTVETTTPVGAPHRSDHPYRGLPASASWQSGIAAPAPGDVDPVVDFKFRLRPTDKVATAGSCFAQHIARHLQASGFNYLVVEPGHPLAPREVLTKYQYGTFSARYGNIYTSRQLIQLFDRAFGVYTPREDVWTDRRGRCFDPFRPRVQPDGFATAAELQADRGAHLAAVRSMFEGLDVFVFTLGLTETWVSAADGAALPVCPGVVAGRFDADRHRFLNLGLDDVVSDLDAFLDRLRGVNPGARVILTVSPVPLAATAEPRHVLVSTTLSKAVLRVAADVVAARHPNVAYFPSYEIITGNHARGRYFGPDLRSVTEDGVGHVMRLFLRHATEGAAVSSMPTAAPSPAGDGFNSTAAEIVEVICDEEALAEDERQTVSA